MSRPFPRPSALAPVLLAPLLLALPALGCGDDGGSATALSVSVKTDLTAGSDYTAMRVVTYAASDSALKKALSQSELRAGQLTRPVVINADGQKAVLVAVSAVGPSGKAVVSELLKASFAQGKTSVLEVFVAEACLDVSCGAGQTCLGQPSGKACEGTCASVPEPDLRELTSAGDEDAWTPDRCGSAGGDGGSPDAGGDAGAGDGGKGDGSTACTLSIPGAACDLVSQCGCTKDEQCVLTQVSSSVFTPDCVPDAAGGIPFGICDTDVDCPGGYGCVNPGVCLPYCAGDADCPKSVPSKCNALGSGSGSNLAGVRVCDVTCLGDGDCVSVDQYCNANGICVSRPDLGDDCDANSGCLSGGACILPSSTATTGTCTYVCTSNAECDSGCCVEIADGTTICGAKEACTLPPGTSCSTGSGSTPPYAGCSESTDCCGGTTGAAYCVDVETLDLPSRTVCAAHCSTSAECGANACCTYWNDAIGNVCQPRVFVAKEAWDCLP